MLLLAAAVMTVTVLASCSKDNDNKETPEPAPVVKPNAQYLAKFTEDLFDYAEVTVTIHCDGKDKTYKMDETTKVANVHMELIDAFTEDEKVSKAGRVLQIPAFQFDAHPITFTTNVTLTEAGKQKIAQATTEEIPFGAFIEYGLCDAKGNYTYPSEYKKLEVFYKGTYVAQLEDFLATFNQNKDVLNKTFR